MTDEHVDNYPYENSDPYEYELYSYEQAVGDPLRLVIEQYLTGQPLTWTGPDRIHFSIAATLPPPSTFFDPEQLEEQLEDQGRDFWDAVVQVAFMLGYHQAAVSEGRRTEQWKELYDQQRIDYLKLRAEHPLPEPTEEMKARANEIVRQMWKDVKDAAADTD